MERTQDISLKVYPREKSGKSAAFRLRKAGFIPAVVYGPSYEKGLTVGLEPRNFTKVFHSKGRTSIVTLDPQEGAPKELASAKVFFKEVQGHSFRNEVLHVDIHQLDLKKPLRVVVPLHFVGKAKGLQEGGIMSILSREVEIKALPENIPAHIDVDVSALDLNESLKIEELAKVTGEQKYEFIFDTSFALVAIVSPDEIGAAATPAADATAAAAAPGAAATPAKKDDAKPAAGAKAGGKS